MDIKFELNDYHRNTPDEDLINDLRRVATYLKKNTVTGQEYDEYGKYSSGTFDNRFGSWNKALEKARLEKTKIHGITDEQYFENLEEVWIKLGRQPKRDEIYKPLSKYSSSAYERKFGTWRKALEKFVEYVNKEDAPQTESEILPVNIPDLPKDLPIKHKTKRNISWRLRFIVMKRDGFRCKLCGTVQKDDPNTELEVDHIKAWTKGGETVLDNLQTLCRRCNGGKSNLEM